MGQASHHSDRRASHPPTANLKNMPRRASAATTRYWRQNLQSLQRFSCSTHSSGLCMSCRCLSTGDEQVKATVTIRDEKLQVSEGHN
jgi:hypothetical protein